MIYGLSQIESAVFKRRMPLFPKHIFSDYLRKSLSGHPMHIEAIVNLLTLFLDRLIPWRLPELRAHTYTFANNLQLPFFESTEGRK